MRVVILNEAFATSPMHDHSTRSPGGMMTVDFELPPDADVANVTQAMLDVGETLAPVPEGGKNAVAAAGIGGGAVRVRPHARAADRLKRRELASDLRAALLARLTSDGLIGGEAGGGV